METKGTNDASFRITLNKVKIDKFNSENLKIYAEEIVDINIRIIKVKIKKWNHRHTINKFTKINSNTRKIKTIIWQSIENRN